MPPTASSSPNTPASAGSTCRSRPCRTSCQGGVPVGGGQELLQPRRPRLSAASAARSWRTSGTAARGKRPVGASTITQQVAKNFLLTNEVSYERKIKEALLALSDRAGLFQGQDLRAVSERDLSRARLLRHRRGGAELLRQAGHQLTSAEAAYLAALPKAPDELQSVPPQGARHRAAELGASTAWWRTDTSAAKTARRRRRARDIEVTPRPTGTYLFASEYFAEEVRRQLDRAVRREKLYEGGLSVRTTLDPKLQVLARRR